MQKKQRNNTLRESFGAIEGFYLTSVTTLLQSSLQLDTKWKGILVTNDVPTSSNVDDKEILKNMLSYFEHGGELLSVKMVCISDYSINYSDEKSWNANAHVFDFHSSQWMHYTRSPTPTDNAPNVSSYSTHDYIDMIVKDWKVAVFEVVNLTEKNNIMTQYLSYMGGQDKVYCPIHTKFPLITAPTKHECHCSYGSTCGEKVKYKCPDKACVHSICQYHHNEECNLKNEGVYKKVKQKPQVTEVIFDDCPPLTPRDHDDSDDEFDKNCDDDSLDV